MKWLGKLLLGIDPSGVPELKAEIEVLRQEVAALERRDYLLQKIDHLEQRLSAMAEGRNAPSASGQAGLPPAKKLGCLDRAWAHFEDQVDEKVVRWVFIAFALLILLPAVQIWREAPTGRDFPEYLSYVFPIAAAIAAGLTAYREDRKGRYFLGSLFLLFMGVDAFIAAHPHQERVVLVLNGVVAVGLFAILVIATVRSTRKAWKTAAHRKRSSRFLSAVGVLLTNGALCYVGVFAVQYASAIYVRARPCIASDPGDLPLCPHSIYPTGDQIFSLRQNLKVIWGELNSAESPRQGSEPQTNAH